MSPRHGRQNPVPTTSVDNGARVRLESMLPASVPLECATAAWCYGAYCFPDQSVEDLRIVVDGVVHQPGAWRMPRIDPGGEGAERCFWGTVPIGARDRPGAIDVGLAARLATGSWVNAPLARIEVVEAEPPVDLAAQPEQPGDGLVVICMGTFDPDPALFHAQVESIRAQTDRRWICLISDDCSSPECFEQIEAAVAADPRFAVTRSERRLGFYRNFERALGMTPKDADLVALCDQDDHWYPEKLEVLRGALGEAGLVYSDQRLVDHTGRVLRETFWEGRRNNHTSLASLLVANSITGAAALFRREVAELALPFPDAPGFQFHDHWIGLVALAMGEVAFVDRPLYDYVQHVGAVFGDVSSGEEDHGRRACRGSLSRWRAAYFYGYVSRQVQAHTLLARLGGRLSTRKRRELKLFVSSERSLRGFAWLATRPLRGLLGRNETLGSEGQLALGILWRWLAAVGAGWSGAPRPGALDARLPEPGELRADAAAAVAGGRGTPRQWPALALACQAHLHPG